jgi:hypothetical protein
MSLFDGAKSRKYVQDFWDWKGIQDARCEIRDERYGDARCGIRDDGYPMADNTHAIEVFARMSD